MELQASRNGPDLEEMAARNSKVRAHAAVAEIPIVWQGCNVVICSGCKMNHTVNVAWVEPSLMKLLKQPVHRDICSVVVKKVDHPLVKGCR
jgi:hypothetical protein